LWKLKGKVLYSLLNTAPFLPGKNGKPKNEMKIRDWKVLLNEASEVPESSGGAGGAAEAERVSSGGAGSADADRGQDEKKQSGFEAQKSAIQARLQARQEPEEPADDVPDDGAQNKDGVDAEDGDEPEDRHTAKTNDDDEPGPEGEEPEAEEPEGEEPEGEKPEDLTEKLKAEFEERIGEATRKQREAERERDQVKQRTEALEREVTSLRAEKVVVLDGQDKDAALYAHIGSPEALGQAEAELLDFQRWAVDHPEGGTYVPPGAKEPIGVQEPDPNNPGKFTVRTELTEREVKGLLVDAERDMRLAIPKRREFLQRNAEREAQLLKIAPQLKEKDHPITQRMEKALAGFPEMKRVPGYKQGALAYALGQMLIESLGGEAVGTVEGLLNQAKAKGGASKNGKARVPVSKKPKRERVPVAARGSKRGAVRGKHDAAPPTRGQDRYQDGKGKTAAQVSSIRAKIRGG
jgi:hypothetical protein